MAEPPILESYEGEAVSPELGPLLRSLHATLAEFPVELARLHRNCDALLRFLASPTGRTNANCWAASSFVLLNTLVNDERDLEALRLPEAYANILSDLGGALHDTFSAPDIAENFEATPELLLARLQAVPGRAS